ncbi:MAG TPA: T9SS type A sorting domain-containing protein [Hanamia sp.]
MKLKIYLLNLFLAILLCTNAYTQNVINYTTSSLNTGNSCNVFNVSPPVSVSGFVHYPVSGGAIFGTYGGSAKYLQLNASYNSSPSSNLGTAYAISYPFTTGFTYTTKVNAAFGGGNGATYPTIQFGILQSLPNPNYTNATACGDVNENYWDDIGGIPFGPYITVSQSGNYTYTAQSFVAPSGYNFLYVLINSFGTPNIPVVALLNSITITKTANLPLTPATLPIQCGNTTAQTFTVSNPYSIPGIQSYTWNLGASNGWLYNGSAAPATITTTTNTITLTPVCGGTQKSITASATISGTSYPANNPATVTITPATPTMSGSGLLCSGSSTYSVTGLPCNATVAWSVSPSGLVSLTPNGSSATITQLGDGNITLTATITSSCSVSPLSKGIIIGQAPPVNIYGSQEPCIGNTNPWSLSAEPSGYGSNWYWYVSFLGTNASIYFSSTDNPNTICSVIGGGIVSLNYTDLCGVARTTTITVYSQCGPGQDGVIAAPNPTTGSLTVSTTTSPQAKSEATTSGGQRMIYQIKIVSQSGAVLKQFEYPSGIITTTLDISSLPNGIYTMQVYDNVKWSSQQIDILK